MLRVLILPTLLLGLIGALCMLTTGARTQRNDEIVFASNADVNTLDPQEMSWATDIRLAMGLWEGLLTYDPVTLKPISGCAQMLPISPDGLTYTFKLRPNLRWSNGDPLTAQDFADSWKRALDPSTENQYVALFFHIAGAEAYHDSLDPAHPVPHLPFSSVGIKVLDPLTIQITLNSPCPYFPDLIAFSPFYPLNLASIKRATDAGHEWTHPPYLVSDGPYVFKEWQFKSYMLLEPNPYYYDRDKVHCQRLRLVTYDGQDNAALLAYSEGLVDVLSWVPQQYIGPELVAEERAGKRKDVFFRGVFGTYYYSFNCKRPPFDDPRVRQAFAMTINKQEIVDNVTKMGEKPLNVLIPPDSIPGYTSPQGLGLDPDRARALLAAAGFPGGRGFPDVELLYNNEGMHLPIAQAIGQMWSHQLGVHVIFRGVEKKQFHAERAEKHNFAIARGGWYGDYPDPTTWLDLARSNNGDNDGQFSNARYDAMMAASDKEPDPAKRFAILAQAEHFLLVDQCAFIPLFQYSDGYMYDPTKIAGCTPNVRLLTEFKFIHRLR